MIKNSTPRSSHRLPPVVEQMESRQLLSASIVVTNQGAAHDSQGRATTGWTGFLLTVKADAGEVVSAVDFGEDATSTNGIFGSLLQAWTSSEDGTSPTPVGASVTDTNAAIGGTDSHLLVQNRLSVGQPIENNDLSHPTGAPANTASKLWGTGTYLRAVFGISTNQINSQPLAYVVLKNGTSGNYKIDVAERVPGQPSHSFKLSGTFGSGAVTTGSIAGNLFNDLNGDGARQTGEGNLSGRTFYLDTNKNGKVDTGEAKTTTDASGNYKFSNLAANATYRVRELLPTGWRVSLPTPNWFYDVPIASGQNVTGKNFADTQRIRIAGNVFNDANGNKVKDATETGLSGWRVYIDLNNNGKFDSTEANKITDSAGNYLFNGLKAGTWRVRVAPPAGVTGFTTTTPAGGVFTITLAAGGISNNNLFGERKV